MGLRNPDEIRISDEIPPVGGLWSIANLSHDIAVFTDPNIPPQAAVFNHFCYCLDSREEVLLALDWITENGLKSVMGAPTRHKADEGLFHLRHGSRERISRRVLLWRAADLRARSWSRHPLPARQPQRRVGTREPVRRDGQGTSARTQGRCAEAAGRLKPGTCGAESRPTRATRLPADLDVQVLPHQLCLEPVGGSRHRDGRTHRRDRGDVRAAAGGGDGAGRRRHARPFARPGSGWPTSSASSRTRTNRAAGCSRPARS